MPFIRIDADGNREEVDWDQFFAEGAEQQRAALAGEVSWGPWRFNPETFCLEHHDERDRMTYQVALDQCRTSAQVLDWICQIAGKTWADDRTLAGLVNGLDFLLRPQATLCSGGVERGPIDPRALLVPPK